MIVVGNPGHLPIQTENKKQIKEQLHDLLEQDPGLLVLALCSVC